MMSSVILEKSILVCFNKNEIGSLLALFPGPFPPRRGLVLVGTMESLSGNVGFDSAAFLLTTELFEHANQIVACLITGAAYWHSSACVDAN